MNLEDTTDAELDAAVAQARSAYVAARDLPLTQRASWLRTVADHLDASADILIPIAIEETNLGETRLRGELLRTSFQLRLMADEIVAGYPLAAAIDHADPGWAMGPRPDLRRMNVPLGVVGVFGASNFPFAFSVAGGDTASALAAGCSVVHKIHSAHPTLGRATEEVVRGALDEAGAPEGLFAAILGRPAGEALVEHPDVKAIGFTGSTTVGRALFDRASARAEPIPFFGELGSINPVLIAPHKWSADRDEVLSGFVQSFTLGMGQFCTKPGVVFIPLTPWDEVVGHLAALTESVVSTPMLTDGMLASFTRELGSLANHPDVITLVQGTEGPIPEPTVLGTESQAVIRDPALVRTEMFGPASILVRYRGIDDLARALGALEGQLTATIHADAQDLVEPMLSLLRERSGRLVWNAWPTGVTVSVAQQHGGPYPATTAPSSTSVGMAAIARFMRPVSYQGFPDHELPKPLQEGNPWGIARRVDGAFNAPEKTSSAVTLPA